MLISRTDRGFRSSGKKKNIFIAFVVFLILFFVLKPLVQKPLLHSFEYLGSLFINSKLETLQNENAELKNKLSILEVNISNASSSDYMFKMGMTDFVRGALIVSDMSNVYDTVYVNRGSVDGVTDGVVVFTAGLHPIGKVVSVDDSVSRINLLTRSDSKLGAVVRYASNTEEVIELNGDGAYGFYATVPMSSKIENNQDVFFAENPDFKLGVVVGVVNNENENQKIIRVKSFYSSSGVSTVFIQK